MRRRPKQNKDVLVSGGVDINSRMSASKKGMYFTGNEWDFRTYSIKGGVAPDGWELTLVDLGNGVRYIQRFANQMWIGRQMVESGAPFLALPHDKQMSKIHCKIYENSGSLCIADHHSKNHTYVNGKHVDSSVWLQQGCTIKIGTTKLKVERIIRVRGIR